MVSHVFQCNHIRLTYLSRLGKHVLIPRGHCNISFDIRNRSKVKPNIEPHTGFLFCLLARKIPSLYSSQKGIFSDIKVRYRKLISATLWKLEHASDDIAGLSSTSNDRVLSVASESVCLLRTWKSIQFVLLKISIFKRIQK